MDLQTTLARSGMKAEYIEDEGGSVDDLGGLTERALKIRLLRRGEVIIENDDIGIKPLHEPAKLLDLAGPDIGFRDGAQALELIERPVYGPV